ncbi:YraN family protein [Aquabacterium sp. OR-4]|uniref:YraN family protein n=1 Tax=Aquabacterium sp. OR-4 TaxID=2978127 RepID=UPI0021B4D20C|nr:YraN family protein [Aquabacterium sp. OR-4]MDT7833817.1 YraN family protein [Aquabacterium sp. OR-4]
MFKAWGRGGGSGDRGGSEGRTTKAVGDDAEARALAHLQAQGLTLLARNYRLAGGPRQRGAEIDLICRERDGTLVFVEVRARRSAGHGGAAASVGHGKQQRIVRAAQHYLLRFDRLPPCRFDVVAIDGGEIAWLRGAFEA